MSLLDESLAISSELGMWPPMERVLPRNKILKARLKVGVGVSRHYETIVSLR